MSRYMVIFLTTGQLLESRGSFIFYFVKTLKIFYQLFGEGHMELCNEVVPLSPGEHLVEFEPETSDSFTTP